MTNIKYHESWTPVFNKFNFDLDQLSKPYFPPTINDIFKVFEMPVTDIKVVLLGQDPYYNPGIAHGFSFSVNKGVKIPDSLVNIFKEIKTEFPERNYNFTSGNLDKWFHREKIFLLNAALTVQSGKPESHLEEWVDFTNEVMKHINKNNSKCVYLLLGAKAKLKSEFIDNKSRIVYGVHPSPRSADKGFFDSGVFKKVEKVLGSKIDWSN